MENREEQTEQREYGKESKFCRKREAMPLRLHVRASIFAVGLFLLCGFLVSLSLKPHPAGLGTHQQLGLPPCFFRTISGLPCPACGMTTSFSHFVRLDWLQAARTNIGGLLLAIVCLITLVWSFVSAVTGKAWLTDDYLEWLGILCCIVLGVVVVHWVVRIYWIVS